MYSVYLVDDEALVLDHMQKSVPWAEHGLAVVGSSTDPLRAIDEIVALCPEAVFTDINMPVISGFEMITQLRQKGVNCELIVISVCESYQFARQLMISDGFDYLIKPVEESQYTELLTRLLSRLNQKYPHRNLPSTTSSELNQIIRHLNRNIIKKHSLKEIAQQFNISSNYVCSLFSKHLQTTFSAYQTKIRMEAAARLLSSPDKPVKDIALECGYEDYFYFCRVFREYYACTPTQYRSQI